MPVIEMRNLFYVIVCVLQSKAPGVKSIISKASNAKADLFVEPGDKICLGDLFLDVCKLLNVYVNIHRDSFYNPNQSTSEYVF